jgi:transcriptional regulator with XRE-family HTH domain
MNILSDARARLGLSQKQLADELGVSRSQVTRMENGTQRIRASYLKMIERMLDDAPHVSPGAVPPAPPAALSEPACPAGAAFSISPSEASA